MKNYRLINYLIFCSVFYVNGMIDIFYLQKYSKNICVSYVNNLVHHKTGSTTSFAFLCQMRYKIQFMSHHTALFDSIIGQNAINNTVHTNK